MTTEHQTVSLRTSIRIKLDPGDAHGLHLGARMKGLSLAKYLETILKAQAHQDLKDDAQQRRNFTAAHPELR